MKNLQIFASLCGKKWMPMVVLVTTMWGTFVPDERKKAEGREKELKELFWKDMLTGGCRVERFKDTYEYAWDIIGRIDNQRGE